MLDAMGVVLPAERDLPLVDLEEPVVRNGYAMRIASQIL